MTKPTPSIVPCTKEIKQTPLKTQLNLNQKGKLLPSEADKKLTQKIKKAAQLFDIRVLEHLIIAPKGDYYSFADNGLL